MSQKPRAHKARKRFGQNFLQDEAIIQRIMRAIAVKEDDHLVEIGPGLGALTKELLASTGRLDAIELDRDLPPILRTKFFRYTEQFRIFEQDALEFDFNSIYNDEKPLRIVGNLPYNISTQLIFHLLSQAKIVKDMHFMLQKEVVERMAAIQGKKNYGRLSIMTQYYCKVEPLFIVPPHAFNPAPKVDSAVVRLTPYQTLPLVAKSISSFQNIVRTAFSMRRKTLRNNMKGLMSSEQLEQMGINPSDRPEHISLEQYVKIADYIYNQDK